MGSCCQCLFRFCCDTREQDEHDDADVIGEGHIEPSRMEARGLVESSSSLEEDHSITSSSTTAQRQQQECCPRPLHQQHQGLHEFFHHLGIRLRGGNASEYVEGAAAAENDGLLKVPAPHALRQARSFDSSTDIPCISASEVVVPGSDLQKEMAQLMMHTKLTDDDVECVICMEGFDPTNPRMPTHCGCGQNKTFFHLPCLYQWLEQSEECPSCREKLTWEEFE